jgi:dTMP kinase
MIVSSRDISFSAPKGFIVIEGVNGAGKGTVIQAVCEQLRARGMEPLLTREPGGSPLGPKIRPMLLEHGGAAPRPTEPSMSKE